MAKIAICRYVSVKATIRITLFVFFLILLPVKLKWQQAPVSKTGKKYSEVKHADEGIDEIEKSTGKKVSRLLGNVSLTHNEILMSCDSSHFYPTAKQVTSFSRIHIQQFYTLDIFVDSLFYDGVSENASLDRNVELIDKETHLY